MEKKVYERHIISKVLMFMGLTIAILVFFTNSISKKQQERNFMSGKKDKLELEVEKLQETNEKLSRQHFSLLTDPIAIERYARENLNYVAPGEKVFDTKNFKVLPKDDISENKELKGREKRIWADGFPWQLPAIIILISTLVFYITYCFENHKSYNKQETK